MLCETGTTATVGKGGGRGKEGFENRGAKPFAVADAVVVVVTVVVLVLIRDTTQAHLHLNKKAGRQTHEP